METVGPKLAPFNPTSDEVSALAVQWLELKDTDLLIDLGCGDARFLIVAANSCSGVECCGIEYDQQIYQRAVQLVESNNLSDRIQVIYGNALDADLDSPTAFFVYLVPEGIRALRHKLIEALQRGARIVTYVFSIPQLTPTKMELYKGSTKVYLYTKDSLSSE